ncbi:MAG TPA: lipoyl synthase [Candidatus Caldiarchaeum subterraneum]|uniref:Lipoyl synthase n=1 Tax=Caldiarchaeum subterraneum TaxID=311458 RepID=A0A832ZX20_CALS0|nr:lipoyl synthase [Candidatus Caldarchaeum subterraneum]
MQTLRKPEWVKVRIPSGPVYNRVRHIVKKHRLHTVCEEALCPNVSECWGGGTATLMLMGDICTRVCRFCAVKTGNPGGVLEDDEPERVADAVSEMGISYVVLTSVCRDDLPDGGAEHFADTVRAIKRKAPEVIVEVLIPDFNASRDALAKVVEAKPEVIGHNVETVPRLTPLVRDRRASFEKSIHVLKLIKELDPTRYTKSSIMLGLGETQEEVISTLKALREASVDIVTLGQYLRPTLSHIPVREYIHPSVFEYYKQEAEKMGFLHVASGPLVRSSYRAGEFFIEMLIRQKQRRGRV